MAPLYVTALGISDRPEGWRVNKAHGGCLIDVPANAVVAEGLSMPHSPRCHDARLWLLESGRGRLLVTEPPARPDPVIDLPGFTRGLALHGRYAFVGLSKVRETATFGGLPIAERVKELKSGVYVVDVRTGTVAASLEFETAVEEIFDVQVLASSRFPEVIGFYKNAVQGVFIVPPEGPVSR